MKKVLKVLLLLSLIFNFFSMIPNVYAEYNATVIDSEGLHVRSGPGTNYSSITVLKLGSIVTLVSDTKHSGTGCNGWYQINYNGSTSRYVCSTYVKVNTESPPPSVSNGGYYTSSIWGYRINEDYIYVRSSASTTASLVTTLYLGTTVNIIGEAPSGHLNYYRGYNTITQNSAGDIIFYCSDKKVHIYVSDDLYFVDFLDDEDYSDFENNHYIGTLNL